MKHTFAAAAVAVLIAAAAAFGPTGTAHGEDRWAINGVFRVVSNGQLAQTNDVYHDENVVESTWTIATSCTGPIDCSGEVHSDQGWSAPIYQLSGTWYVKRTVPGWEPCSDGTAADGQQLFRFWPAAPDGTVDPQSSIYAGADKTTGASGACGINKWLTVSMPLKLTPLS